MRTKAACLLFLFLGFSLTAQVKIGQNPETIDPASILELDDDNKALVLTRISDANMKAMVPLQGALAYNIDLGCVFYFNGTAWENLCNSGGVTNENLVIEDNVLTLTDSNGGQVSVALEPITAQTFTADPIQNFRETILITQNGNNFNFEVLEITGDQIADSTILGVDIAEETIRSDNLAPNSVGQSELSENSVADNEIDYSQVTLNDFFNDAGYLTGGQLVSPDVGNSITDSNGAYYDDTSLINDIQTNAGNITQHLADDTDTDETNELVTDFRLDGNNLILEEGTNTQTVNLDGFNNTGSDDQTLTEVLGEGNDAGGQLISNLLDPASAQDAATRNYVDTAIATIPAGSDNQNLTDATLDGANLLTIEIEDGDPVSVDLSVLAGGGAVDGVVSNVAFDGTNLNFTGANGGFNGPVDISALAGGGADGVVIGVTFDGTNLNFVGANGGFNDPVDISALAGTADGSETIIDEGANITITGDGTAGDPYIINSTATGGSTELADGITIVGDGSAGDEFRIAPSGVNGQFLRTDPTTGDVVWDDLPTGTGGAVSSDGTTIVGDGVATDLQVVDGGITPLQLNDMGAANGEVLKFDGAAWGPDVDRNSTNVFLDFQDNPFSSNRELYVRDSDGNEVGVEVAEMRVEILGDDSAATPGDVLSTDGAGNYSWITPAGGGGADDQNADEVPFDNAASGLAATDTQAAIDELDTAIDAFVDTDDQNADEVPYDNTTSGLTATDAQAAIDEIVAGGTGTDDQNADEVPFDNAASGLAATDTQAAIDELDTAIDAFVDTDDQNADEVPYDNTTSGLTATDAQAAIDEIVAGGTGTDDQNADEVPFDNAASGLAATDTQAAIDELDTAIDAFIDTDDQNADEVPYDNTTSGLTATDAQAAIDEIVAGGTGTDDQNADEVPFDNAASGLAATDTQAAIDELDTAIDAFVDTDDQNADEVPYDNTTSGLTATDAQAAIDEIVAGGTGTDDQNADEVPFDNTASGLAATDTQAAIDELDTAIDAFVDTDDQNADEVPYDNTTSGLTATDAQAAIDEIVAGGTGTDDQNADEVPFDNAASGLAATDTQAAIDELDTAIDAFVDTDDQTGVDVDLATALDVDGDTVDETNVEEAIIDLATENFAESDLTLDAARNHDLDGNNLVFGGSGFVGIGSIIPQNKFHVAGAGRFEGILNSDGVVDEPSYRFSDDTNTGMWSPAADQLAFSTGDLEAMRIDASQNVGIGLDTPLANLHVDGDVRADGGFLSADTTIDIPDYVFQNYFDGFSTLKEDYQFKSLEEIEAFVKKHKHLPGVTSATQAQKDGFWNLSQSNLQNLEKIEELFLHTIEQEKKIETLSQENQDLKSELSTLKAEVEAIKKMLEKK